MLLCITFSHKCVFYVLGDIALQLMTLPGSSNRKRKSVQLHKPTCIGTMQVATEHSKTNTALMPKSKNNCPSILNIKNKAPYHPDTELFLYKIFRYAIGSKSAAPCLQSGQTMSSGSVSPSYTQPQTLQTKPFLPSVSGFGFTFS